MADADSILGQLNDDMYAAHVTIAELSRRTGLHVNTLSRYLNGTREIRLSALRQILEALELELGDFADRAHAREKEMPGVQS